MTQQTKSGHLTTAAILALVGGILIILGGILFLAVSTFILLHIDIAGFPNVHTPPGLNPGSIPAGSATVFIHS